MTQETETVQNVLREMRERKVNNGKHTSPTLEAWADRIERALASPALALNTPGEDAQGAAGLIVRDACELDPADPEDSETVCIKVNDLTRIVERHTRPAPTGVYAADEVEYEYEVWQSDAWQAGGSCTDLDTARNEASHYALMYGQDGPVTVKLYEKREITAALAALAEGENGNG